jgi:hypothetical protein
MKKLVSELSIILVKIVKCSQDELSNYLLNLLEMFEDSIEKPKPNTTLSRDPSPSPNKKIKGGESLMGRTKELYDSLHKLYKYFKNDEKYFSPNQIQRHIRVVQEAD